MAKITFLGTTCMQPTKDRNHSGLLLSYKNENILFDCGEGTQRQMRIAGIKLTKITRICISHWHGDHVLGLPGLLSSMGADQFAKTVHIYAAKGSKKYFEHMKKAFFSVGLIDYTLHEVDKEGVVYENDDFQLEAYNLKHSTPCVGFAFQEKDKLKINTVKAKKLGLKEGPILGELANGYDVTHKGKKILAKDVTYVVKGKRMAYVADTRPCDGAMKLALDANLLVIESTFHSNEKSNAVKHKHMTAKESAMLASNCGVKKLVLTHPSLRYKTISSLLSEAQDFHDDVVFAEDFMKISF